MSTSELLPLSPNLDKIASPLLSHDIWAPNKTIGLSPFVKVRERGADSAAKSAIRALDTLELLARVKRPLRAVEIAGALGLSSSSTHQLLKTMVDSAYLMFDPHSKRYHPSLRSSNFGGSLTAFHFGPGVIDRLMRDVYQHLGGMVTISASQGSFMQVVEGLDPVDASARGRKPPLWSRQLRIGLRVPVFGSCTGAAWLAAQDDEAVLATARLCRRELDRDDMDTQHVLEIVDRVRRQGYAFGGLSADDTIRALAMALPSTRSGTILVMAVTAPTQKMEECRNDVARCMKEKIASHLG